MVALQRRERVYLRQFLVTHFDLGELECLAFDLGVSYEIFRHETKQELSLDLIGYFECRNQLSCLVAEVLRQRPDDGLARLVAKLPPCVPSVKIQILVAEDMVEDVSGLLGELATKLKLAENEVSLIGAARRSIRLLVGLSEKAADFRDLSEIHHLCGGKYRVISIQPFDSLDSTSQKAWRWVAYNWPPIHRDNTLQPAVSWQDALAVARTESQVFVARKHELEQLDGFLTRALAGHGQVCFVTGEAGTGKTALVTEFARRVQEQYKDLIVAVGQCDALTGAGDPYLPFREVLSLLTGDVEAKLAQGIITQKNADRLKRIVGTSVQLLVEIAPDLIGTFVPLAGLVARVAAFAADKAGVLDRLKRLAQRPLERGAVDGSGIEQSYVFGQYTNVLQELAIQAPLMLILDDLHWADAASVGLLFRLGRRIQDSRILIVGTYRPAEVTAGRNGEPHPLEKVLAEFQRYFGDILVDLDDIEQAEACHFVDSFLDTEPNRLSKGFRQTLCYRTGGNPFFTIELLRHMQDRGDIVRDEQGQWVEGAALNWGGLPASVEGVIQQRIDGLGEDLRDILDVASVEGERFTAQVVARVQDVREHEVSRALSRMLEKRYRLVCRDGETPIDQRFLSHYRFAHVLFQHYVYNELDPELRRQLHERVGSMLEELYGDQADEIAVQLVRHFEESGTVEKAIHYLHQAGEQAVATGALKEALGHFKRAYQLLEHTSDPTAVSQRARLCYYIGRVYETMGRGEDMADALAWRDKGRAELPLPPVEVALLHILGGIVYIRKGELEKARPECEKGLSQAEQAGSKPELALAHRMMSIYLRATGCLEDALVHCDASIAICDKLDDRIGLAKGYTNQGVLLWEIDKWELAPKSYLDAITIYKKFGPRFDLAVAYCNLGDAFRHLGDLEGGFRYAQRGLEILTQLESAHAVFAHIVLATLCWRQGDLEEARGQLLRAHELEETEGSGEWKPTLGRWLAQVHLDEGKVTQAKAEIELLRAQGTDRLGIETEAIERLWGQVLAAQGDLADAVQVLQGILKSPGEEGAGYETARTRLALAGVLVQIRGRETEAREHAERARETFADLGARLDLEEADRMIARLLAAQGQLTEAVWLLETSAKRQEPPQVPYQTARTLLTLACLLAQLEDRAGETLAYAERARAIFAALGHELHVREADQLIARVSPAQGQLTEVVQMLEVGLKTRFQIACTHVALASALALIEGRKAEASAHAEHARAIFAELDSRLGLQEAEELITKLGG